MTEDTGSKDNNEILTDITEWSENLDTQIQTKSTTDRQSIKYIK